MQPCFWSRAGVRKWAEVTYLEKAKESLEKEMVAEVAKIQEELSGKLLAEQSRRKKAEQRLEVLG